MHVLCFRSILNIFFVFPFLQRISTLPVVCVFGCSLVVFSFLLFRQQSHSAAWKSQRFFSWLLFGRHPGICAHALLFFFLSCVRPCLQKKKTKRMKQPFGGSGVYPKNASPHFRALCLTRAEVAAQCHASQVGRLSHNFDEVSWSLL